MSAVARIRVLLDVSPIGSRAEARTGLAEALEWIHAHEGDLRWIGDRGMPLVAPYAKEIWADRILAICGRAGR